MSGALDQAPACPRNTQSRVVRRSVQGPSGVVGHAMLHAIQECSGGVDRPAVRTAVPAAAMRCLQQKSVSRAPTRRRGSSTLWRQEGQLRESQNTLSRLCVAIVLLARVFVFNWRSPRCLAADVREFVGLRFAAVCLTQLRQLKQTVTGEALAPLHPNTDFSRSCIIHVCIGHSIGSCTSACCGGICAGCSGGAGRCSCSCSAVLCSSWRGAGR